MDLTTELNVNFSLDLFHPPLTFTSPVPTPTPPPPPPTHSQAAAHIHRYLTLDESILLESTADSAKGAVLNDAIMVPVQLLNENNWKSRGDFSFLNFSHFLVLAF